MRWVKIKVKEGQPLKNACLVFPLKDKVGAAKDLLDEKFDIDEQSQIDWYDPSQEMKGDGRGERLHKAIKNQLKKESMSQHFIQVATTGAGVQGAGIFTRFHPRCKAAMLALVKAQNFAENDQDY